MSGVSAHGAAALPKALGSVMPVDSASDVAAAVPLSLAVGVPGQTVPQMRLSDARIYNVRRVTAVAACSTNGYTTGIHAQMKPSAISA